MPNDRIEDLLQLKLKAIEIRRRIVRMIHFGNAGHIGTALSVTDILTALYYNIMTLDPARPRWDDRDRCVLSKGNGAAALYAVLGDKGYFSKDLLESYCFDGSPLIAHTDIQIAGVESSTGSLGHGLPIGVGMALSQKTDKKKARVFVVHGDGECNEGSVWEAAMTAYKYKLDNLTVIVDHNKLQATGYVKDVMPLEPFVEKWEAFGFAVRRIDGHDMGALVKTLKAVPFKKGRPSAIIADTVKAKGLPFLENDVISHYRPPNKEQMEKAMKDFDRMAMELQKRPAKGKRGRK